MGWNPDHCCPYACRAFLVVWARKFPGMPRLSGKIVAHLSQGVFLFGGCGCVSGLSFGLELAGVA